MHFPFMHTSHKMGLMRCRIPFSICVPSPGADLGGEAQGSGAGCSSYESGMAVPCCFRFTRISVNRCNFTRTIVPQQVRIARYSRTTPSLGVNSSYRKIGSITTGRSI